MDKSNNIASKKRNSVSPNNLSKKLTKSIETYNIDEDKEITFKDKSILLCENIPIKAAKQSLLSAFMYTEDPFSKPGKTKVKKKRQDKSNHLNNESLSFLKETKELSENSSDKLQLQKNIPTLQKLGLRYIELKKAIVKSRQAYSNHKLSTYFFSDNNFIKEFAEYLQKAEDNIENMGQVLDKVLPLDKLESVEQPIYTDGIKLTNGDLNKNEQHHGSLTPPHSEVGNYDNMSSFDDSTVALSKKRKLLQSDEKLERRSSGRKSKKNEVSNNLLNVSSDKIDHTVSTSNENSEKINEIEEIKSKVDFKPAEYEVGEIKDYVKKQGVYYYHVSWKGYDSADDTYEPADNLTGCDEALVSFFHKRLVDRQSAQTIDDLKNLNLPCDPSLKSQLLEAFEKFVLPLSQTDKENMVKILVSSRSFPLKDKNELKEEVIKFLALKDPTTERYIKYYTSLVTNISLQVVNEERMKQLACLRSWERNMNLICTDPSPIQVENNVDLALPPLDFIYINDYIAGPGITIPDNPMVGCECQDCNSSTKGCCSDQMGSYFGYTKYGKLRVSLGTPIYECNKLCKCSPDCINRIVQRRRRISLSIFRTSNGRGWGVKTLEHIKKDTFVTEYVGEVISSEEAERRGMKYDSQGCTYLFDLDYNKGELNPYTVDAAKCGNVSHFINHSCDPNLVVYNVWIDCLDPDLPKLALFAVSDIKKGEEITFDYNSGSTRQMASIVAEKIDQGGLAFQSTSPVKDPEGGVAYSAEYIRKAPRNPEGGKSECRCGAVNCRKFFF